MRIAMIMAMDKNRLIGKDGGLPWHISSDLKRFKKVTMGKPMIMGRKTFESIGRPLPGRTSIVVTRNAEWTFDGVKVAGSLEDAMALAGVESPEEVMIIGGASICKEAMPMVERLYLTVIDHAFDDGDTWLDSYDASKWTVVSEEGFDETADGGYRCSYAVLERLSAPAVG